MSSSILRRSSGSFSDGLGVVCHQSVHPMAQGKPSSRWYGPPIVSGSLTKSSSFWPDGLLSLRATCLATRRPQLSGGNYCTPPTQSTSSVSNMKVIRSLNKCQAEEQNYYVEGHVWAGTEPLQPDVRAAMVAPARTAWQAIPAKRGPQQRTRKPYGNLYKRDAWQDGSRAGHVPQQRTRYTGGCTWFFVRQTLWVGNPDLSWPFSTFSDLKLQPSDPRTSDNLSRSWTGGHGVPLHI